MDVLIVYQFCTFGGVERAVLNRMRAFQRHGLDIRVSVGYLHDSGALQSFQDYIHSHDLSDHLSAFVFDPNGNFDWNRFDLILVIDTPQVLERLANIPNVFVECHTPYRLNRQYLKTLPENIRGLIVPSESFKALLLQEFSVLPPISVIPNLVSEEFYRPSSLEEQKVFPRRPIAYFARLDGLKNIAEALEIFSALSDRQDVMQIIIGQGAREGVFIDSLRQKGLLGTTLLRNEIAFDQAPALTALVRRHRGIFLSPSTGESFGLSAAEFIASGVPALLSDIPAHRELVQDDERFLYPLGDISSAREKLLALLEDWDDMSQTMKSYGERFRDEAFYTAWLNFLSEYGLEEKTDGKLPA